MQEQAVSKQLDENIAWWKQQFSDCADIKMRPMCLGRDMSIRAFLSYIEVTGKRTGSFGCHTFCTDVGSGRRDADR